MVYTSFSLDQPIMLHKFLVGRRWNNPRHRTLKLLHRTTIIRRSSYLSLICSFILFQLFPRIRSICHTFRPVTSDCCYPSFVVRRRPLCVVHGSKAKFSFSALLVIRTLRCSANSEIRETCEPATCGLESVPYKSHPNAVSRGEYRSSPPGPKALHA